MCSELIWHNLAWNHPFSFLSRTDLDRSKYLEYILGLSDWSLAELFGRESEIMEPYLNIISSLQTRILSLPTPVIDRQDGLDSHQIS